VPFVISSPARVGHVELEVVGLKADLYAGIVRLAISSFKRINAFASLGVPSTSSGQALAVHKTGFRIKDSGFWGSVCLPFSLIGVYRRPSAPKSVLDLVRVYLRLS
jgi:hypothetical protein